MTSVLSGDPTSTATEFDLGPISQILPGEGRAYAVAGQQVAVFHLRDGTVRAVSAICPHRGGPIADGQIDSQVVLCPLHMNAFDLRTGCSTTGAEPLRSYPVRVTDERIVLTVA